jgi:hypothetical protein
MSKFLTATLGIAVMLMASTALADNVSVPSDGNALPTNRLAPGPVVPLNTHVAEVLPPMGSARGTAWWHSPAAYRMHLQRGS